MGKGYEGVYPVGEAGAQVYVSGEDGVRVRGYGEWALRVSCGSPSWSESIGYQTMHRVQP